MARLPTFIIVGAQKCGTSTLAAWLRDHPEVHFSERKELHFFSRDDNWSRGVDWYAEQFSGHGGEPAVGEATPHYMNFPAAVARMAEVVPDAKLIVCVRDPVERAYSSYRHMFFRLATEHRTFDQAIKDELRESAGLPQDGDHCDYALLRYLVQGRYADHIDLLLTRFPREQLHVMRLDDMQDDPRSTFDAVCRYLGIAPGFTPPEGWQVENAHRVLRPVRLWRLLRRHRVLERMPGRTGAFVAQRMFKRDATPLSPIEPDLRARMEAYFAEPNRRLATWLGRDLSGWSRT